MTDAQRVVWVVATCDTKGVEAEWLVRRLEERGVVAQLVDTGCIGPCAVPVSISRDEVFAAAGITRAELVRGGDRAAAVNAAARGVAVLARAAHDKGRLAGVVGLGGSAGTAIGTAAMRALPIGVPKLMVSTLASGAVRAYVRDKDILMLNAVVDIAGLNRISKSVLATAASAMVGLVQASPMAPDANDRPLVAATMFGVTTPCVEHARRVLEDVGYEVVVFHATGSGGEALESLIREGLFAGVLDLTTTELADELVGGVLSAGPTRLTAAAECGVPQVVSVGALDMVNFRTRATVPERFAGRKFHEHNSEVTLMRTTSEENALLGAELASKVARSTARAAIFLPALGVSAIDRVGQPFDDPGARRSLFDAIHANAGPIECQELDFHLNDPGFAEAAVRQLVRWMER